MPPVCGILITSLKQFPVGLLLFDRLVAGDAREKPRRHLLALDVVHVLLRTKLPQEAALLRRVQNVAQARRLQQSLRRVVALCEV